MLCKVQFKSLEKFAAKLLMRDFTATKMNGSFHLIAILKYPHRIVLFEQIIMFIRAGAELYLFDCYESLFSLSLFLLLLLLVLPFAEVDYSTNRRLSLRRNFYQIKPLAACEFERLLRRHDSYLSAVFVNNANLAHSNALVYANGWRAISPISKASSSLKATDGL